MTFVHSSLNFIGELTTVNVAATTTTDVIIVLLLGGVTAVSSSSSRGGVTWDSRRIEARQGDSLSVTCTVPDLDMLTGVRVERRDDEKQTRMVIADNGDVKVPFAGHRRYRVDFAQRGNVGTTTIHYSRE